MVDAFMRGDIFKTLWFRWLFCIGSLSALVALWTSVCRAIMSWKQCRWHRVPEGGGKLRAETGAEQGDGHPGGSAGVGCGGAHVGLKRRACGWPVAQKEISASEWRNQRPMKGSPSVGKVTQPWVRPLASLVRRAWISAQLSHVWAGGALLEIIPHGSDRELRGCIPQSPSKPSKLFLSQVPKMCDGAAVRGGGSHFSKLMLFYILFSVYIMNSVNSVFYIIFIM